MTQSDLLQYLNDILADSNSSFLTAELQRITQRGVLDYALYVPYQAEGTITSTSGTLDYTLPANLIQLLSVTSSTLTDLDFTIVNRKVRLTLDPGDDTLDIAYYATYPFTSLTSSWDDIPAYRLNLVGDLCYCHCLDSLADEIDRRPSIHDGQTREDWKDSARNLRQKAINIRQITRDALTNLDPYIG